LDVANSPVFHYLFVTPFLIIASFPENHVSVLVVGSLAIDTIETPFGSVQNALGGSAVYIAAAASYFFKPVRLVGVVGGDFPKQGMAFLEERHVDLEGLEVVKDGKTFRWSGRYHYDLNERDTLFTELNVFEKFDPKIPEKYRRSNCVCLGNIDPVLQRRVLDQIEKPRVVICDTMNYWIERKNKELRETLKLINVLILNDSEARLLSKEPNLIKAAKVIRGMGPSILIIKKGEHGALLLTEQVVFSAPAYPMENIFDPTGAGDAFAGGFAGWLARTDDLSEENLKRAVIYGSTLASFCVEKFGVEGLADLTYLQIQDRFREFRELSRFDED
jgi:sugar/nucleoside kinase (ribokinase family)